MFISKKTYQQKEIREILNVYRAQGIEIPENIAESTVQNIQRTITDALKYENRRTDYRRNRFKAVGADTFVFGDVHGELTLFIQNLYLAGVIDASGNYDGRSAKTVVQLGDIVDREGNQPFEAMIYLRMLKKQAERTVGNKVHLLCGNHEKYGLYRDEYWNENLFVDRNFHKILLRPLIRDILREDIKNRTLQLCYAHPDSKLLCLHGRFTKDAVFRLVATMYEEEAYRARMAADRSAKAFFEALSHSVKNNQYRGMFKLEEVYQHLEAANISLKDLSDKMNDHFVHYGEKTTEDFRDYLMKDGGGIYGRNKKKGRDVFAPDGQEEKYQWKPVQIVGHTPTTTPEVARRAKGFGVGIMQDRACVFADADLCNGFQAFIGVHSPSGRLYAFELLGRDGMARDDYKNWRADKSFHAVKDKVSAFGVRKLTGLNTRRPLYDRLEALPQKDSGATRLLFIRHGRTDAITERPYGSEPSLDEAGHQQGILTARRLAQAGVDPDGIYSSPLLRSLQTASYAARKFSLPVHRLERLQEIGGDILWENRMTDRPFDKRFLSDWDVEKLKGELVSLLTEIERISVQNKGKTLVIFTHGGVIRLLRSHFNNPGQELTKEQIKETHWCENASITVLERNESRVGGDKYRLLLENDRMHLMSAEKVLGKKNPTHEPVHGV